MKGLVGHGVGQVEVSSDLSLKRREAEEVRYHRSGQQRSQGKVLELASQGTPPLVMAMPVSSTVALGCLDSPLQSHPCSQEMFSEAAQGG